MVDNEFVQKKGSQPYATTILYKCSPTQLRPRKDPIKGAHHSQHVQKRTPNFGNEKKIFYKINLNR